MNAHEIIQAMYDGQTLVYGHRGAKAYAPMNTLPAFELAADQGAQGIELDVHRSRDGYPVIVHDFTVDHSTDGRGRVVDMTLAELKALDAGAWFDARFAGTRVPTLDEVFEAVGQRLFVNVEIKAETDASDGVEEVVANCISRHNMQQRVVVSSFNPHTLLRFRALLPDVPLGFLYDAETLPMYGHMLTQVTCEAYHPEHILIDTDLMAQNAGYIINTWTVNDAERALVLRDLGVRGIITDAPDVILKAFNR